MKKLIFIIVIFLFSIMAYCQEIITEKFNKEYKELLKNLIAENWKNSEKISDGLLKQIESSAS